MKWRRSMNQSRLTHEIAGNLSILETASSVVYGTSQTFKFYIEQPIGHLLMYLTSKGVKQNFGYFGDYGRDSSKSAFRLHFANFSCLHMESLFNAIPDEQRRWSNLRTFCLRTACQITKNVTAMEQLTFLTWKFHFRYTKYHRSNIWKAIPFKFFHLLMYASKSIIYCVNYLNSEMLSYRGSGMDRVSCEVSFAKYWVLFFNLFFAVNPKCDSLYGDWPSIV